MIGLSGNEMVICKKKKKTDSRPKVVIVGANFAGLKAALGLPAKFAVTVVDKRPWFEYLPNIHEIISHQKKPSMLRFSNRAIVAKAGHRYMEEIVTRILPEENQILTQSGKRIAYDYCIMAAGASSNAFGIKGVKEHALPFKSVSQCFRIRRKLQRLSREKRFFYVTVVGGGIEGIESLGEILRRYGKNKKIKIRLIEKRSRLLNEIPADLQKEILQHCHPYAVDFYLNTAVDKITPCYVYLSSGQKIKSDATIWTAGAKPNALYLNSGFTQNAAQWPPVDDTLVHTEYRNVFFVGDAAGLPYKLSKQAYHAIDMGHRAAGNIVKLASGQPKRTFKPLPKPILISFGALDTFMVFGKTVIAGSALSVLKESVYQFVMNQFDPSGAFVKPFAITNRTAMSAWRMLCSNRFSPEMLLRFGKMRILSPHGP